MQQMQTVINVSIILIGWWWCCSQHRLPVPGAEGRLTAGRSHSGSPGGRRGSHHPGTVLLQVRKHRCSLTSTWGVVLSVGPFSWQTTRLSLIWWSVDWLCCLQILIWSSSSLCSCLMYGHGHVWNVFSDLMKIIIMMDSSYRAQIFLQNENFMC